MTFMRTYSGSKERNENFAHFATEEIILKCFREVSSADFRTALLIPIRLRTNHVKIYAIVLQNCVIENSVETSCGRKITRQ